MSSSSSSSDVVPASPDSPATVEMEVVVDAPVVNQVCNLPESKEEAAKPHVPSNLPSELDTRVESLHRDIIVSAQSMNESISKVKTDCVAKLEEFRVRLDAQTTRIDRDSKRAQEMYRDSNLGNEEKVKTIVARLDGVDKKLDSHLDFIQNDAKAILDLASKCDAEFTRTRTELKDIQTRFSADSMAIVQLRNADEGFDMRLDVLETKAAQDLKELTQTKTELKDLHETTNNHADHLERTKKELVDFHDTSRNHADHLVRLRTDVDAQKKLIENVCEVNKKDFKGVQDTTGNHANHIDRLRADLDAQKKHIDAVHEMSSKTIVLAKTGHEYAESVKGCLDAVGNELREADAKHDVRIGDLEDTANVIAKAFERAEKSVKDLSATLNDHAEKLEYQRDATKSLTKYAEDSRSVAAAAEKRLEEEIKDHVDTLNDHATKIDNRRVEINSVKKIAEDARFFATAVEKTMCADLKDQAARVAELDRAVHKVEEEVSGQLAPLRDFKEDIEVRMACVQKTLAEDRDHAAATREDMFRLSREKDARMELLENQVKALAADAADARKLRASLKQTDELLDKAVTKLNRLVDRQNRHRAEQKAVAATLPARPAPLPPADEPERGLLKRMRSTIGWE